MPRIIPAAGTGSRPCEGSSGRLGGNAENVMSLTVDTALNHPRPAPTREAAAITIALHAAENEGWNPRPARARRFRQWPLPPCRAGVRRALGSG